MNRYNVDVHLRNGNKFFITTNSFASSATIYLSKLLSNENGDFIIIDDIYTDMVYAIAKEEIEGITCIKIEEGCRNEK